MSGQNKIKAIIFDFDGVIAESVDIKTKAFAKVFEAEGKDIVKKVIEYHTSHTGVSRYDKFKIFYKEFLKRDLDKSTFDRLCDDFSRLVMDEVVNAPYVKGAKEFLELFSSEYKCFIASATPQEEMDKIIYRRSMNKFFDRIYGAPLKKTEIVGKIISENGFGPSDVIFVGDALSDFNAAMGNSIKFVARIYPDNEILFKNIDCLKISDLSELNSIINDF